MLCLQSIVKANIKVRMIKARGERSNDIDPINAISNDDNYISQHIVEKYFNLIVGPKTRSESCDSSSKA